MILNQNLIEKDKINICIIGGGNIGTLLIGDLGSQDNISVRLLTSKPEDWNREIQVYDRDNTVKYTGQLDAVSSNPIDIIPDADIIISTLPSHIFPGNIKHIKTYIKSGTMLGVMPGSGGCEFFCKDIIENGCILFGFQRVYGIARIKEYGKSVYDLGKKSELYIAAIPADYSNYVSKVVEKILGIKCKALDNYLNITLTPSNSILHTTRLATMFKDYKEGMYWDRIINFYEEWTDDSSELLIACDNELQMLCQRLNELDLSGIKPLTLYYGSDTPEKMTKKIRSITAFKGIKSPMAETENGFIPDFSSRYFQEDFPFGLCIIKGFCELADLKTPNIDKVLRWFERVIGVEYFTNGQFYGRDLRGLPLPQNYSLNTMEDIKNYYK